MLRPGETSEDGVVGLATRIDAIFPALCGQSPNVRENRFHVIDDRRRLHIIRGIPFVSSSHGLETVPNE